MPTDWPKPGCRSDIDAIDAAVEAELGKPLDEVADREAIAAALDPTESVRMRNSRGGPAPQTLRDHIERARETLDGDRSTLGDRRESLAAAERALDTEVQSYV